jgi:hypothetical protein
MLWEAAGSKAEKSNIICKVGGRYGNGSEIFFINGVNHVSLLAER